MCFSSLVGSRLDTPPIPVAITGWGRLEYNRPQPDNLQGANLNTVVKSGCQDRFTFVGDAPLVCVGGRNVNQNSCAGDSGGPMAMATVVNSQRRYHLLGVTSFGYRPCASDTSAYASLNSAAIVAWIKGIVKGQC